MNLTPVAVSFLINALKELASTFKEVKMPEVTAKQQAMIDALMLWGDDYREKISAFATALAGLSGEQFDFRAHLFAKPLEFKPGMIVVPLQNKNSHHYELNVPTCMCGGNQGWRLREATVGDSLPSLTKRTEIRLATKEEIDLFYAELFKKSGKEVGAFFKVIVPKLDLSVA